MSKPLFKPLLCGALMLSSSMATWADNTYSNAVMSLAPVAYWPLNETTQPPLPGNVASNLGTAGPGNDGYYQGTPSTGITGALAGDPDTAASFFTTPYVSVPYSPAVVLRPPFSVEAWANPEGNTSPSGGAACVVAAGEFGSVRSGWLIYNVGSSWSFRLYNQNGGVPSLNITGGTIDSSWHHLVGVYDGTNGSLYVDGVRVAGPTAAAFVPNTDGNLTIGARSDGGFVLNGDVDEVAVYTNALSASDILGHYQNGTNSSRSQSYSSLVLSKNPPFYFRLDETISTVTSTVMAANYGSLGSAVNGTYLPGTQPGVAGPKGNGFGTNSLAVNFNTARGGYIDCTTDPGLDILTPMAVVAWFQGAPADARFQSFLGRSDSSWRADLDDSGYAHFADGGNDDAVSTNFVNDGAWHFFAGVYDGTNTLIYIDGVLDGTQPAPNLVGGNSTADMVIGGVGDYIPDRNFRGNVTQVAVFTNFLTAAQVQTLYYAGELSPSIASQPQPLSLGLGSGGALNAVVKGNPTLVYQWYNGTTKVSDVAGNISGSATPTLTIANAQLGNAGNYTLVITNNYGSVTSVIAAVTVTPSPAITTQPTSNTVVYAGNQVSLSAFSIGAAPLHYQWYVGSSAISGANNTNLTVTTAAGTNLYTLVVTNTYGSATSVVAAVVGQVFVPPAYPFVVNFDAVANGDVTKNFIGQGAYSDPGHDAWNPIGGSGVPTGFAVNSASNSTLVTATLLYGFNNTPSQLPGANGLPSWLLTTEDGVNSAYPGIGTSAAPEGQLTVNDLPQGSYTLYLYADNYDANRGSIFALGPNNSGGADGGTNATANAQANGNANNLTVYAEGDNYVMFTNVVPDATGAITVTYVPNDANPNILHGEAPFNGVQLVLSIRPTLTIHVSGTSVTVSWNTSGTLQSAPVVTGPYNDVVGATSPYTTSLSGTQQYFRLKP